MLRTALEHFLGQPRAGWLSNNLARLGLHGLGVGLPPTPDQSGEKWLLKSLFAKGFITTALDVGANVGDYTEMLLDLGVKRVAAFEPVPDTVTALKRRFQQDERVTVFATAVGEADADIDLHVPADSATSVLASRGYGASAFTAAPLQKVKVPMVTLDAALAPLGLTPDFLKIDVEGFEPEVLAGAHKLIASGSLKAVQIEFSYHHLLRGTTLMSFESHLPDYRFYRLARRSLRPLDSRHYLGTIYGFSNLVALRHEVVSNLRHLM